MSDELLQRLADESDLRDLIHRYAFGLDNQDWVLWRSVFIDRVTMDMSDYDSSRDVREVDTDRMVGSIDVMFAGLDATQHFMGSHRYAIDGDTAVITAHMRAEHWMTNGAGGDRYTMYGTYTDQCVRTDDGWKMTAVKLALIREEGNRHVMGLAAKKGAALRSQESADS